MNETISSPKIILPIEKDHNNDDSVNISSNIDTLSKNDTLKKTNGKKYCFICNKRLKIMSTYDCRCGGLFCMEHRTPEYHNCKYDYVNQGNKYLTDKLQKIDHDKIDKF